MSNYVERFMKRLEEKLPDCDPQLLKYYTLLGLVDGPMINLKDVHDAWALWRNDTNPEHKSLIPFNDLTQEVQELDRPYADAINAVAREVLDL